MKEEVKFSDFIKLDMRVGLVVEAKDPDWSNKLLELTVDFGKEIGRRTIFAGVKGIYTPEYFIDKKGVFVVNLEAKKMGRSESQGMMLMSVEMDENGGETKVVPLEVGEGVPIGTVVR